MMINWSPCSSYELCSMHPSLPPSSHPISPSFPWAFPKYPQPSKVISDFNSSKRALFPKSTYPPIQPKSPLPFPLLPNPEQKSHKRMGCLQGNCQKSSDFSFPEYFLSFFLKASRFSSSVNSSFFSSTRLPSSSGAPISILQSTSSMNMGARGSRWRGGYSVEPSLRFEEDYYQSMPTLRLRCRIRDQIVIISRVVGRKGIRREHLGRVRVNHTEKEGFGVALPLVEVVQQKQYCMNSQQLPPIQSQKRYGSSIPSGRISQFAPTEVPIISKRGTSKAGSSNAVSMHDITDPALIDQKLKSLSHTSHQSEMRISMQLQKKEKANLKFLRYKFNPNSKEDEGENVERGHVEQYGQLGKGNREKISVNVFYELKNVLFQDERAPLIYKKLFLEKEKQ